MKKTLIKSIPGTKIQLEPFSLKFVTDDYLNWMNDKDITKFIHKAKDNMSIDDLNSFANKMINSDDDYFFAIKVCVTS